MDTCAVNDTSIPSYLMEDILIGIAKQALDKINKTRISATSAFMDILHAFVFSKLLLYSTWKLFINSPLNILFVNCSNIPVINQLEDIRKIFPKVSDTNWARECDTFPLFVQLLGLPNFTRALLNSFIRCVGSVTESLVCRTDFLLCYRF